MARLTLREALPLHVGDRLLLRDPGSAGVTHPRRHRARRGTARARAARGGRRGRA